MEMRQWTPKGEGVNFEFSRILKPLEAHRAHVTVLSGLADKPAIPRKEEGTGDHARAASTWLTGVHVKKTEGPDIPGRSIARPAHRARTRQGNPADILGAGARLG